MTTRRGATTRSNAAPLPRTAYTPREIASSLGWSYKRVLGLIHTGRLRHIQDGQHYIVPVAALQEFLDAAST